MNEPGHISRNSTPPHESFSVGNPGIFTGLDSILWFIKNLWLKLLPSATASGSYAEVIDFCEHLKDIGRRVKIYTNNSNTLYTGRITAVNREHGMLVIEMIKPPILKSGFQFGKNVSIESEENDQKIIVPCYFVDTLVPNTRVGYQLKLPGKLEKY